MTEAFGEKAIMNLRFMFPDDHIPTDDTGFREFLNRNFLRTINLFSDIRNATAKVAMKPIALYCGRRHPPGGRCVSAPTYQGAARSQLLVEFGWSSVLL